MRKAAVYGMQFYGDGSGRLFRFETYQAMAAWRDQGGFSGMAPNRGLVSNHDCRVRRAKALVGDSAWPTDGVLL